MQIIIRTDASTQIGTGHVMRCVTLAESLRARGAQVCFVCREFEANLCGPIQDRGFEVVRLPAPSQNNRLTAANEYCRWLGVPLDQEIAESVEIVMARPGRIDWLIVDSYSLDYRWERALRSYVGRIMVIDDLANRLHDCDILLDQNCSTHTEKLYRSLVPPECVLFIGPEYALLRPEFVEARKRLPSLRDRVLVFFGGVDATGETVKALTAMERVDLTDPVDVVIGANHPQTDRIQKTCERHANWQLHVQTSRMAELMGGAGLSLGAGGITTLERLYMRLPSITVAVAANQKHILEHCATRNLLTFLGASEQTTIQDWCDALIAVRDRQTEFENYEFELQSDRLWYEFQSDGDPDTVVCSVPSLSKNQKWVEY